MLKVNLWIVLQSTEAFCGTTDGKFEMGAAEAEFGITTVGESAGDGTVVLARWRLARWHIGPENLTSSASRLQRIRR